MLVGWGGGGKTKSDIHIFCRIYILLSLSLLFYCLESNCIFYNLPHFFSLLAYLLLFTFNLLKVLTLVTYTIIYFTTVLKFYWTLTSMPYVDWLLTVWFSVCQQEREGVTCNIHLVIRHAGNLTEQTSVTWSNHAPSGQVMETVCKNRHHSLIMIKTKDPWVILLTWSAVATISKLQGKIILSCLHCGLFVLEFYIV